MSARTSTVTLDATPDVTFDATLDAIVAAGDAAFGYPSTGPPDHVGGAFDDPGGHEGGAWGCQLGRVAALPDPAAFPDPAALCCAVVRSAAQVLRGERDATSLARWVTPEVLTALSRAAGTRPGAGPISVIRLRPAEVAPGITEAGVVIAMGERVRAAAVRLEVQQGLWRVTALEIG